MNYSRSSNMSTKNRIDKLSKLMKKANEYADKEIKKGNKTPRPQLIGDYIRNINK